jgi:hypothetical protein
MPDYQDIAGQSVQAFRMSSWWELPAKVKNEKHIFMTIFNYVI